MMIQSRIAGHVPGLLFPPAVSALIYLRKRSSVLHRPSSLPFLRMDMTMKWAMAQNI